MGTMTITAAGFTPLGASPPANWPSDVTWPAGGNPNGTKVYTWTDADWVRTLAWIAGTQQQFRAPVIPGKPIVPTTPTAQQILLAYVQNWVNGTIQGEQQFSTIPPQVPPPISPS
jgi:hypothetical protein